MTTESNLERVRREDLHLFINAGLTATGQGGYYHGKEQERLSLAFLHKYIATNYRQLYSLCLAAGLNDHNLSHSIFTLLASGTPQEQKQENQLLGFAVKKLPPHRAYRLFERLAQKRVNNRRTRAVIAGFLNSRHDLVFDAIKYRKRLRRAVKHAHFKLPSEVSRFLFEGAKGKPYSIPMLETYRKAQYDASAIFKLPFSVAQGLAQRKGIDQKTFMKRITPMMTEREKLRAQASGAGEFDPSKLDLVELCVYYLKCDRPKRMELLEQMKARAATHADQLGIDPSRRVAAVLDRSRSSFGGVEGRRRPLALALAVHLTLEALYTDYNAHWSCPTEEILNVHPRGHTALARPLLEALEGEPDLVVVVSDGRENAPRGACQAIAKAMTEKLPEQTPQFLHLNPVFNPDDFMPVSLGEHWPTVGVKRVEDLGTALAFARFADGAIHVRELLTFLQKRAEEMTGAI